METRAYNFGSWVDLYHDARGKTQLAPTYPAGLNGTFELAIDLPTSADADRVFERVVQAGATCIYAPRDEPWGMHASMIADPEGNLVEIGSWNRGVKQA